MTHPLFAGIGGHHSARSKTDEWLTPPGVLRALGPFDLDPCSPVARPWPTAREHYTVLDNGLIRPWFGRVWLNPPYSTELLGRFMARMSAHGRGTALIFARTETDAFFRFVWESASALLFIRGRLNFHHVSGERAGKNSGAPSVLCAYGQTDAEILLSSGIDGHFVPLRLPRVFAVAMVSGPWSEIVQEAVARADGPIALQDLYRIIAEHPKARGRKHYAAKVRQVLQRGPYRNVRRGVWAIERAGGFDVSSSP